MVITALHNVVTAKAAFEALLPGSIGASVINPLAAAALTAVETLFNVRYQVHYNTNYMTEISRVQATGLLDSLLWVRVFLMDVETDYISG